MTFVMRDVVIITLIVVKLSSNGVDKNTQFYATRYCKTLLLLFYYYHIKYLQLSSFLNSTATKTLSDYQ